MKIIWRGGGRRIQMSCELHASGAKKKKTMLPGCPLILLFYKCQLQGYICVHITKQDSDINPCYTVATLHCCKLVSCLKLNRSYVVVSVH